MKPIRSVSGRLPHTRGGEPLQDLVNHQWVNAFPTPVGGEPLVCKLDADYWAPSPHSWG